MATRPAFSGLVVIVALALLLFGGCGDDSDTEAPEATYSIPSETTQPETSPPEPEPEPERPSGEPEGPSASYPLTEQTAYGVVTAGIAVAGLLPSGLELLILESSETAYERQPVEKEICDEEYDPYEEDYEQKCRYETVYEDRPVEKTVYVVRGGGYAPLSFEDPSEAFARAYAYGVRSWRQA